LWSALRADHNLRSGRHPRSLSLRSLGVPQAGRNPSLRTLQRRWSIERHIILGVHITNRLSNILDVQKVFTDYGGHIRTRLGLHGLDDPDVQTPKSLIILEMVCDRGSCDEMVKKLQALEGVECQRMVPEHP